VPDRGSVEEVLEAYAAAVHAKDVDAFVGLYDGDARVFDMWGRWSYDDAGAWRGVAEEWFGSLGSERVIVDLQDVRTTVGDGVAVAHAFVTFRALSAEGDQLRAMNNRLTWGLRRTDAGGWKIVHEHTSAPVDFETAKVMLERSPS
jgi:ketosteroid isomerase-like protein